MKGAAVPGSLHRPDQSYCADQPDAQGELRQLSPRSEPFARPDGRDEPRSADRAAAPDQPVPWSRAGLRERLERLPPGHPSSPHNADLSTRSPSVRDRDTLFPSGNAEQGRAGHDAPGREPDAIKRDYWSEVPRFLRAWVDHEHRWPAELAAAVGRSHDPAGSWRGDGDQYLNPEEHTEAKDEITAIHRKEEGLTQQMGQAERDNACGGWLAGLEFSLKGEDRLKEKIAEVLKRTPSRSVADVVRTIPDAVRYTFCFESANYADGYQDIKQQLEAREYKLIYSKNHWHTDPEYKGINTRWVTSEGQRFEVQFHTAESYHAKQKVTHKCYERLRNSLTHDDERRQLRAFQRDVCSWITAPGGAADIVDYPRKDDR